MSKPKADGNIALPAGKGKEKVWCDVCKTRSHQTKDCFSKNAEKRKAWEKKTGKKWVSKEEYKKKGAA